MKYFIILLIGLPLIFPFIGVNGDRHLTLIETSALLTDIQIQQGVDGAASQGGGEVVVSPGTYDMRKAIIMRSNVFIRFLPGVILIKNPSFPDYMFYANSINTFGLSGPAYIDHSGVSLPVIQIINSYNWEITGRMQIENAGDRGIRINGGYRWTIRDVTIGSPHASAIYIGGASLEVRDGAYNFTIDNVTVSWSLREAGLWILDSEDGKVSNITSFYNALDGLRISGNSHHISIMGGNFRNNLRAGIYLESGVSLITIVGVKAYDIGSQRQRIGVFIGEGVNGVIVDDSILTPNTEAGLFVAPSASNILLGENLTEER